MVQLHRPGRNPDFLEALGHVLSTDTLALANGSSSFTNRRGQRAQGDTRPVHGCYRPRPAESSTDVTPAQLAALDDARPVQP